MQEAKQAGLTFSATVAADKLGISRKTIYRYIADNLFEDLVVIPREKRPHYLFSDEILENFLTRYQGGQAQATQVKTPRRVYNRRVVKGQRKKKRVNKSSRKP